MLCRTAPYAIRPDSSTLTAVVQFLTHVQLFGTPWIAMCARLVCLSLSPRAHSNSCPLSQWCYLTISSSTALFFSPSIFPSIKVSSSGSALHIRGQTIEDSVSASNEHSGLISLQSKGLSRVFSSTTIQKHQFFSTQPSLWYNSHTCTWLLGKPCCCCCSVTQLCLTLWPHGLQPARLPCPSLSLRVFSSLCPFSWWCHPTISSFLFSPCPQYFPTTGPFPKSQIFASGSQSIGA